MGPWYWVGAMHPARVGKSIARAARGRKRDASMTLSLVIRRSPRKGSPPAALRLHVTPDPRVPHAGDEHVVTSVVHCRLAARTLRHRGGRGGRDPPAGTGLRRDLVVGAERAERARGPAVHRVELGRRSPHDPL